MSRGAVAGGDTEGRLCPHLRRQARELARRRSPFWGMGDVPPEGLAPRPRSHLRLPVQRLVRPTHSAFGRWWEDLDGSGQRLCLPGRGRYSHVVRRFVPAVGVHQDWHLEPSPDDPATVFAGAQDAALYRSTDAGETWDEMTGLRRHATGSAWQPGAGGLCLHTILLRPGAPEWMAVAISAAGVFRSDDGGRNVAPRQQWPAI